MDSAAAINSFLYRGHVSHRRAKPEHQFRYATTWAYLDLEEIDRIVGSSWWLGDARFSACSFRREDHFGDPELTMADAVRSFLSEQTGVCCEGPIRLLTQLRNFGVYFSPINVFYCFDRDGSLAAMVAEVSNTPWRERHCYVLWSGNRIANSRTRYVHAKDFHVSPFMGMDSEYHWRIGAPGDRLNLSLACCRDGERIFQAHLHLTRTPLTDTNLFLGMARRPVAAAQILSAIYFEAFRLWMKKCQFYPHPVNVQASDSSARTITNRVAQSSVANDLPKSELPDPELPEPELPEPEKSSDEVEVDLRSKAGEPTNGPSTKKPALVVPR